MKLFWKFFLIIGFVCLSACQTLDGQRDNAVDKNQNDLMKSANEKTLNRLKYVIRSDLQFERGCRERGIEIAECDYPNSLEVEFTAFDCKTPRFSEEELMKPNGLPLDFKNQGAVCDYQAELKWPDGANQTVSIKDEHYEYGITYMDELIVEYGWSKKRPWN
jgi:cytochrome oxidase assembly protein ShyY1